MLELGLIRRMNGKIREILLLQDRHFVVVEHRPSMRLHIGDLSSREHGLCR
jgi:hypothetical protein